MISIRRAAALAAALALASTAVAHEGGIDARGTVVEVSAKRIVVKTPQAQARSFTVTGATEVRRGTAPVQIGDVRAGEKVVVHGKKTESGDPEATSIRLAKEPAPSR